VTDAVDATTPAATTDWQSQPHAIVERDGVRYTLLGTAHVSSSSVEAVRAAIDSGGFDTIAVELDPQRLQSLTDPGALASLDLVQVIRSGKTALFAANLGLAAYQRRLAEQLGIEPGAELKAAALDARARGLVLHLIDRDVGITFKRASQRLGWWGRAKLMGGLVAALFGDEEVGDDEIEKLKQGDLLEASFGEFAADNPALYDAVIAERDRYMAARLRESATASSGAREVLAVVGAGHLQGLSRHLREDTTEPVSTRAELESV
jgi:pheromone shutdown-related protein TraB